MNWAPGSGHIGRGLEDMMSMWEMCSVVAGEVLPSGLARRAAEES